MFIPLLEAVFEDDSGALSGAAWESTKANRDKIRDNFPNPPRHPSNCGKTRRNSWPLVCRPAEKIKMRGGRACGIFPAVPRHRLDGILGLDRLDTKGRWCVLFCRATLFEHVPSHVVESRERFCPRLTNGADDVESHGGRRSPCRGALGLRCIRTGRRARQGGSHCARAGFALDADTSPCRASPAATFRSAVRATPR